MITPIFFTISNGVRQGGILSPTIFALTDELSNSYAGCYINDKYIHHNYYVCR